MASVIEDHLKTGNFLSLYLLYGEESYLKSHYCRRLAGGAVAKGTESFNLHLFDGELNLSRFAAALGNMPLMSEKKCVILRDIDPDALGADEWEELEQALAAVPEECILILHFDAVAPDKRGKRWKRLLAICREKGVAAEMGRLPAGELARWVEKRVRQNGCRISREMAGRLIETCGRDMTRLCGEIDKLCAFASGGEIGPNQMDALSVKPLEASVYDLARAITAGNTARCLRILDELFYKKEEPVMILAVLSGAFCDLYRAKTALESGATQKQIESDFNYRGKEFRVGNALRDCRRQSAPFLSESLKILMKTDERLKSSRTDKRVVLEQLIFEMDALRKRMNRDTR